MTITLCIETSSAYCSVALGAPDVVFARTERLDRSHNEHLLEIIDGLYRDAELEPTRTELVAFGCGPGSFTGVRIGAAASQGLAFASGARVVPLPSPLVLALSAKREIGGAEWVVSVRSRGDAYYLARYRLADGESGAVIEERAPALVESPPSWLADGGVVVGEAPPWLPEKLSVAPAVAPLAEVMLEPARARHAAGASLPAELALPTYIEGDSPWRKKPA